MTNFEEKLNRLEKLSQEIRKSDISLEEALKDFEEGIKIAKGLEKELDSMEKKIQIMMNTPDATEKKTVEPELSLFDSTLEVTGTRA